MDGQFLIENCSELFRLVCPLSWDQLQRTEETNVRLCGLCKKNVYFCTSVEEIQSHSLAEDCIAVCVKRGVKITDPGPMIGQPKRITALGPATGITN